MPNKVDDFIDGISPRPLLSGGAAIATFGGLGLLSLGATEPFMAAAVVSPIATPILAISAGISLFRERSKLSKAFSVAAIGAATVAMIGYGATIGAPGWEALGAFVYSTMGMAGASALNLAAHYTKNIELTANMQIQQHDIQPQEQQPEQAQAAAPEAAARPNDAQQEFDFEREPEAPPQTPRASNGPMPPTGP